MSTAPAQRTALFAGTFDPFTIGHMRLVERCLTFADRVVVAVGYNDRKTPGTGVRERVAAIGRLFAARPEVGVTAYSGLTAAFAREAGATFLLRGVRGMADFEYERNLADINLRVLGMETVLLVAEPEFSYVSSSALRELRDNGFDIGAYLPEPLPAATHHDKLQSGER